MAVGPTFFIAPVSEALEKTGMAKDMYEADSLDWSEDQSGTPAPDADSVDWASIIDGD